MESGVKLLIKDLKEAIERGVKVRVLTGNYLNITEPSALYLIREALGDSLDLRLYNVKNKSFHPKAYMFHKADDSEIYIGSSNISRGALTTSVEWNYRFNQSSNTEDFNHFYATFEDLFFNHSTVVDDEVLAAYSKSWSKPRLFSKVEEEEEESSQVVALYEPRGAQIEALYALKQTREEGWDRGIVVAATGIGKTYLAAFDSKDYKRILFVGHREEILKQASSSFQNVRETDSVGFFYSNQKEMDKEVTFALVQTLGKLEYLTEDYFATDAFDYIIIDECHHATAKNYEAIRNYFKPKFWLFLTATPERMDNEDVFEIANWNMVYEVRLKEAINKGWLVPFRYYGIYDDTVDYSQIDYKNGKYDKAQLDKELMIGKRAHLVLKHYQKYGSKRAMGFCSSKAHAEYMANYFQEHGVAAAAVYSDVQGEMAMDRTLALAKLTSGELQIVFSVDMFNEGVDVPSIDMVLFLRPTESQTVFLQQLGRGLRKYKHKHYLNVLDFIGNYKKAQFIPFLLGDKAYNAKEGKTMNPQMDIEMPEDCLIDFDFRLVDLFKEMAKQERSLRENIQDEYDRVKEDINKRPSRLELFKNMEDGMYLTMKSKTKENIFRDYMSFLEQNGALSQGEQAIKNACAGDFIQTIETTDMSKTYKMPLLLAFYNQGQIKQAVTEQDLIQSFKDFYRQGSNNIDLLKDKGKKDYTQWEDSKWLTLIKNNPVKALLTNTGQFFEVKDGYMIALNPSLTPYLEDECFVEQLKDVIDFRLAQYYRERFTKRRDKNKIDK